MVRIVKDIEIALESLDIRKDSEIRGTVSVNYSGKYDSIVINTQILNSNELMTFTSYNGKKISQKASRLFISKDSMPQNKAEFTAAISFDTTESHDIKFRASIIEQHKEIESDVLFARYS
jgi:CRISPR/Cas system-associated protein Csm6